MLPLRASSELQWFLMSPFKSLTELFLKKIENERKKQENPNNPEAQPNVLVKSCL